MKFFKKKGEHRIRAVKDQSDISKLKDSGWYETDNCGNKLSKAAPKKDTINK